MSKVSEILLVMRLIGRSVQRSKRIQGFVAGVLITSLILLPVLMTAPQYEIETTMTITESPIRFNSYYSMITGEHKTWVSGDFICIVEFSVVRDVVVAIVNEHSDYIEIYIVAVFGRGYSVIGNTTESSYSLLVGDYQYIVLARSDLDILTFSVSIVAVSLI